MKTNNLKPLHAIIAYLLCGSVVLSGAHAKDLVKQSGHDNASATVKHSAGDITAKALSELHNHTDKTTVKNMAKATVHHRLAARERELKADVIKAEQSLSNYLEDTMLFWRLALSLRS